MPPIGMNPLQEPEPGGTNNRVADIDDYMANRPGSDPMFVISSLRAKGFSRFTYQGKSLFLPQEGDGGQSPAPPAMLSPGGETQYGWRDDLGRLTQIDRKYRDGLRRQANKAYLATGPGGGLKVNAAGAFADYLGMQNGMPGSKEAWAQSSAALNDQDREMVGAKMRDYHAFIKQRTPFFAGPMDEGFGRYSMEDRKEMVIGGLSRDDAISNQIWDGYFVPLMDPEMQAQWKVARTRQRTAFAEDILQRVRQSPDQEGVSRAYHTLSHKDIVKQDPEFLGILRLQLEQEALATNGRVRFRPMEKLPGNDPGDQSGPRMDMSGGEGMVYAKKNLESAERMLQRTDLDPKERARQERIAAGARSTIRGSSHRGRHSGVDYDTFIDESLKLAEDLLVHKFGETAARVTMEESQIQAETLRAALDAFGGIDASVFTDDGFVREGARMQDVAQMLASMEGGEFRGHDEAVGALSSSNFLMDTLLYLNRTVGEYIHQMTPSMAVQYYRFPDGAIFSDPIAAAAYAESKWRQSPNTFTWEEHPNLKEKKGLVDMTMLQLEERGLEPMKPSLIAGVRAKDFKQAYPTNGTAEEKNDWRKAKSIADSGTPKGFLEASSTAWKWDSSRKEIFDALMENKAVQIAPDDTAGFWGVAIPVLAFDLAYDPANIVGGGTMTAGRGFRAYGAQIRRVMRSAPGIDLAVESTEAGLQSLRHMDEAFQATKVAGPAKDARRAASGVTTRVIIDGKELAPALVPKYNILTRMMNGQEHLARVIISGMRRDPAFLEKGLSAMRRNENFQRLVAHELRRGGVKFKNMEEAMQVFDGMVPTVRAVMDAPSAAPFMSRMSSWYRGKTLGAGAEYAKARGLYIAGLNPAQLVADPAFRVMVPMLNQGKKWVNRLRGKVPGTGKGHKMLRTLLDTSRIGRSLIRFDTVAFHDGVGNVIGHERVSHVVTEAVAADRRGHAALPTIVDQAQSFWMFDNAGKAAPEWAYGEVGHLWEGGNTWDEATSHLAYAQVVEKNLDELQELYFRAHTSQGKDAATARNQFVDRLKQMEDSVTDDAVLKVRKQWEPHRWMWEQGRGLIDEIGAQGKDLGLIDPIESYAPHFFKLDERVAKAFSGNGIDAIFRPELRQALDAKLSKFNLARKGPPTLLLASAMGLNPVTDMRSAMHMRVGAHISDAYHARALTDIAHRQGVAYPRSELSSMAILGNRMEYGDPITDANWRRRANELASEGEAMGEQYKSLASEMSGIRRMESDFRNRLAASGLSMDHVNGKIPVGPRQKILFHDSPYNLMEEGVFYSKLDASLKTAQKKGTVQQLRKHLQKNGVKANEMDMSGMEGLLRNMETLSENLVHFSGETDWALIEKRLYRAGLGGSDLRSLGVLKALDEHGVTLIEPVGSKQVIDPKFLPGHGGKYQLDELTNHPDLQPVEIYEHRHYGGGEGADDVDFTIGDPEETSRELVEWSDSYDEDEFLDMFHGDSWGDDITDEWDQAHGPDSGWDNELEGEVSLDEFYTERKDQLLADAERQWEMDESNWDLEFQIEVYVNDSTVTYTARGREGLGIEVLDHNGSGSGNADYASDIEGLVSDDWNEYHASDYESGGRQGLAEWPPHVKDETRESFRDNVDDDSYHSYIAGSMDQDAVESSYREILLATNPIPDVKSGSNHWNESNVFAHVRYTSRETVDGRSVLFLEEVQSDWRAKKGALGREAKKRASLKRARALEITRKSHVAIENSLIKVLGLMDKSGIEDWKPDKMFANSGIQTRFMETLWLGAIGDLGRKQGHHVPYSTVDSGFKIVEEADALGYELGRSRGAWANGPIEPAIKDLKRKVDRAKKLQSVSLDGLYGTGPNPFAKNWPDMAMERMIRFATSNGYDAIAVAPSELPKNLYSLFNRMDHIHVAPTDSGRGEWVVRGEGWRNPGREGEPVAIAKHVADSDLESTIGATLAAKVRAGHSAPIRAKSEHFRKYDAPADYGTTTSKVDGWYFDSSVDIGGSWADNLYGDRLPRFMMKRAKKTGGTFEQVQIKDIQMKVDPEAQASRMGYEIKEMDQAASDEFFPLFSDIKQDRAGSQRVYFAVDRKGNPVGTDSVPHVFATQKEALAAAVSQHAPDFNPKSPIVHAIGINPKMREALNDPFAVMQTVDGKGRAMSEFTEDGHAFVSALEGADATSALHEFAHVARRQVLDRNTLPKHRVGILDEDIKAIEDWAGAKEGRWTRDAEEKFAEAVEQYLRTGEAPDPLLKRVFSKISEFFARLYKAVTGTKEAARINPEVKQVLDKLFTRGDLEGVSKRALSPEGRELIGRLSDEFGLTTREAVSTYAMIEAMGLDASRFTVGAWKGGRVTEEAVRGLRMAHKELESAKASRLGKLGQFSERFHVNAERSAHLMEHSTVGAREYIHKLGRLKAQLKSPRYSGKEKKAIEAQVRHTESQWKAYKDVDGMFREAGITPGDRTVILMELYGQPSVFHLDLDQARELINRRASLGHTLQTAHVDGKDLMTIEEATNAYRSDRSHQKYYARIADSDATELERYLSDVYLPIETVLALRSYGYKVGAKDFAKDSAFYGGMVPILDGITRWYKGGVTVYNPSLHFGRRNQIDAYAKMFMHSGARSFSPALRKEFNAWRRGEIDEFFNGMGDRVNGAEAMAEARQLTQSYDQRMDVERSIRMDTEGGIPGVDEGADVQKRVDRAREASARSIFGKEDFTSKQGLKELPGKFARQVGGKSSTAGRPERISEWIFPWGTQSAEVFDNTTKLWVYFMEVKAGRGFAEAADIAATIGRDYTNMTQFERWVMTRLPFLFYNFFKQNTKSLMELLERGHFSRLAAMPKFMQYMSDDMPEEFVPEWMNKLDVIFGTDKIHAINLDLSALDAWNPAFTMANAIGTQMGWYRRATSQRKLDPTGATGKMAWQQSLEQAPPAIQYALSDRAHQYNMRMPESTLKWFYDKFGEGDHDFFTIGTKSGKPDLKWGKPWQLLLGLTGLGVIGGTGLKHWDQFQGGDPLSWSAKLHLGGVTKSYDYNRSPVNTLKGYADAYDEEMASIMWFLSNEGEGGLRMQYSLDSELLREAAERMVEVSSIMRESVRAMHDAAGAVSPKRVLTETQEALPR